MHAVDQLMTDAASRIPVGPPLRCPYCLSDVELVAADVVYPNRPELADRKVWRCTNCDASVGCHRAGALVTLVGGETVESDGSLPMGSLANPDLRAARIETHRLFDAIWQPPARMSRSDAYSWMAKLLGIEKEEAHIAALSYDECIKVQLAIEDLMRAPGEQPELPGAGHWLLQAGIEFTAEQDGRLVVKAGDELIDFFPDKQTWSVRGLLSDENEGLHSLVMYCKRPKRATRH